MPNRSKMRSHASGGASGAMLKEGPLEPEANAAKDFLDHLHRPGADCRFHAADLVGAGCHDSYFLR